MIGYNMFLISGKELMAPGETPVLFVDPLEIESDLCLRWERNSVTFHEGSEIRQENSPMTRWTHSVPLQELPLQPTLNGLR